MKSTLSAIPCLFLLAWTACSTSEVHQTLPPPADKTEKRHSITRVPPGHEKMLADYRPKTSPDRAMDYRPGISKKLAALPVFQLENLPKLVSEFQRWNQRAGKEPGHFQEGNLILGAPPREYRPSDAELMAGCLGDGLNRMLENLASDTVAKSIKNKGVSCLRVSYHHFEFYHVDVMGSGRFFYCSDPVEKKLELPCVQ